MIKLSANATPAFSSDELGTEKKALVINLSEHQLRELGWGHGELSRPASMQNSKQTSAVVSLMKLVKDRLTIGAGAAIIRGPSSMEDDWQPFARAYTRLAQRLGDIAPQDSTGTRLIAVEATCLGQNARGYQRNIALRPHTDFHEFMGLACVRSAGVGGETLLASGAQVYAILQKERPDLLVSLLTGFPESFVGEDVVTPEPAPVFAFGGSGLTIFAHRLFYKEAARKLKTDLPPLFREGLETVSAIAARPDVALRFSLEPGEILFWNNFRLLHGRDAFHSAGDPGRLLLRLWINPIEASTAHPSFGARARRLDALHLSGRSPISYGQ